MFATLDVGSDTGVAARALRWLLRPRTRGVIVSDATEGLRLPGAGERWRCAGCGNLTRFDVTRSRRTTEYWHFDLAGEHLVEEETLRSEMVEAVSCRWCGRHDAIEVVDRASADIAGDPTAR